MQLLKDRIQKDGVVKENSIVKVDSFLNHQMDVVLFAEIGKELKKRFADCNINKILTIEASGIGIATVVAQSFDNCPVVFAKKTKSKNLDGDLLEVQVESYTRGTVFDVQVAKKFLTQDDNVLVIDDLLANGQALLGLIELVDKSNANFCGCSVIIEKGFQPGGKLLREKGIRLESLAIIDDIIDGEIIFR